MEDEWSVSSGGNLSVPEDNLSRVEDNLTWICGKEADFQLLDVYR